MKNIYSINSSYDSKLLSKFEVILKSNLHQSRCVKYYSEKLAISTKKLNSLTKKYYGKTAKEFIEEKIITESKKLLKDSPNTIKQISYLIGFTEPTNFNKFFKKHTSITPQQFRINSVK